MIAKVHRVKNHLEEAECDDHEEDLEEGHEDVRLGVGQQHEGQHGAEGDRGRI